MKKTVINVPFDEEKLAAARLYMVQKELSFEEEMEKAADALYGKYVPANVREFLEMRTDAPKAAAKRKPPHPSSDVGADTLAGGDSD